MSSYYRNELKYICTQGQLEILKQRLIGCGCKQDIHGDNQGVYMIRSIYFDDYSDKCYRENINGENPREKYRIRIYNGDSNIIKLERKRKVSDKIHKDSCVISKEECMAFIHGQVLPRQEASSLYKCFSQLVTGNFYRPKVIVEYERTAFVHPIGNVRVTFDRGIASSTQFEDFLEFAIAKRPIMPIGKHVLEIKYDELLLPYIFNALQLDNMSRTAYSKYCLCRKYSL